MILKPWSEFEDFDKAVLFGFCAIFSVFFGLALVIPFKIALLVAGILSAIEFICISAHHADADNA